MAKQDMGPYRRPTRAALEMALTTLALEAAFQHQDNSGIDSRLWKQEEKDLVHVTLGLNWTRWHSQVVSKLRFILGRVGVTNG